MKRIFVVAALITSSQINAQNKDTAGKQLDEVVVTATKFEQKQSTTGKVVSVISNEQLQKSAGKTLVQVLNEQGGITINGAYNSSGSPQTVFMRGASSGRTLILMDGIPINDASMISNEFDLNLLSINDIERIEIGRGAQSTLYGSYAVAGVINIITTKKDVAKPFNIKATSAFGNKNTFRNNVQLFGKINKLSYTTRFAKLHTDGFSSAYDTTGSQKFDKDGYDGNNINASVQYQFTPSLSAKTFIQHSWYKASVDGGGFADDRDYTISNQNLLSGVGLLYKKGIVNIASNYQYGELGRSYLNDSLHKPGFTQFESNEYNSRSQFAELYLNVRLTKWLNALAGMDHRWGNMNQQYFALSDFGPYASSFGDSSLYQTSYYASVFFSGLKNKLNLELGGRLNKHSVYGNNNTYTFNPSFSITDNWRLFGSIASGFKAPSIFQVYDEFSGNRALEAETSVNYEAGIQQKNEKIGSRLVYFSREIKNGIDYNYTSFKYFNFIKQIVKGFEFEFSARPIEKLSITTSYTFISGEEFTQNRKNFLDTSYNYLLRRPKHNANITLGYQFKPAFFASLSGKAVSSRYDVGGFQMPDILLDNYFLLSAYAEYKLKDHVRFFADAQNITNKKFFDINGYNAMPFLINGGISFNW